MKKIMIAAVLVAGIAIGCNKNEQGGDNTTNAPQNYRLGSDDHTSYNRVNPYDSSGIWHNILLDAIRMYQQRTGDTTKAGLKDFMIHEFQQRVGRIPDIDLDNVDKLYYRIREVGIRAFLSEAPLSNQLKEYLIRLYELTQRINDPTLFPSFQVGIAKLEDEVLKMEMSEREQEALLRMTAITYHSGMFWKNVYDNNSWLYPTTRPQEVRWWQWPIVTNADFIGGLVGFLLGGNRYDIENASAWMSGGAEGVLGS